MRIKTSTSDLAGAKFDKVYSIIATVSVAVEGNLSNLLKLMCWEKPSVALLHTQLDRSLCISSCSRVRLNKDDWMFSMQGKVKRRDYEGCREKGSCQLEGFTRATRQEDGFLLRFLQISECPSPFSFSRERLSHLLLVGVSLRTVFWEAGSGGSGVHHPE